MATDPSFASTPRLAATDVSTLNATIPINGSGTITSCFTAGASGSLITQVTVQATSDPANGILNLFLSPNGTTWSLFDQIDHDDPAIATTTVAAYRTIRTYTSLVLPANWQLGAAPMVALSAGVYVVWVHGADL